jgi:hypothetical protein
MLLLLQFLSGLFALRLFCLMFLLPLLIFAPAKVQ